MSIDGVVRPPLLTDDARWRRAIFDSPQWMAFQRISDSFVGFSCVFDTKRKTLTLTRPGDGKWKGLLAVQRQGTGRMILDGHLGEDTIRMQLSLMDRDKFLLVSRGSTGYRIIPSVDD